jgi:hypothetical protein
MSEVNFYDHGPFPESAEMRGKRARDSDVSESRFVFVSCFDRADDFVEVDVQLLEKFNCRLHAVIRHSQPEIGAGGRPFWRCGMTRAMLLTFIRSLEHGELSLSKSVSVCEALTTFEYENVAIGVPPDRRADVSLVRNPPGVAFAKRAERVGDHLTRTCELVAHALCRWPRLEACLDAALSGLPVTCTCTATRAWVRFVKKPQIYIDRGESAVALARNWPLWVEKSIKAFGFIHAKLVRDRHVGERDRHANAFDALCGAVQRDQLGWLMATSWDTAGCLGCARHSRKESARAAAFADDVRECILSAAHTPPKDEPPETLQYARACFSLAETTLLDAPNLANIFSGSCCDESGRSAERIQLQRSLAQRGIKIVKWGDDEKSPAKPLTFPPSWSVEGTGSSQPVVLLEFAGR